MTRHQYVHLLHQISQLHSEILGTFVGLMAMIFCVWSIDYWRKP